MEGVNRMKLCKIILIASLIFINSFALATDANKVEIVGSIDGVSIAHSIVIDESVYKLHPNISVDYNELSVGTKVRCEIVNGRITQITVLR